MEDERAKEAELQGMFPQSRLLVLYDMRISICYYESPTGKKVKLRQIYTSLSLYWLDTRCL
jgi:hypothetical protein